MLKYFMLTHWISRLSINSALVHSAPIVQSVKICIFLRWYPTQQHALFERGYCGITIHWTGWYKTTQLVCSPAYYTWKTNFLSYIYVVSLTVRSYSEHPSFKGQWIPSPLALPDKLNTCWWHKHSEQFWTPLSTQQLNVQESMGKPWNCR